MKDAYALAFTIECVYFSLFWSQKVHLKAKIVGFITFLGGFINFLVRTLQCEETKLKNRIGHVNMNNPSPKVEYFYCRIFSMYCPKWPIFPETKSCVL